MRNNLQEKGTGKAFWKNTPIIQEIMPTVKKWILYKKASA